MIENTGIEGAHIGFHSFVMKPSANRGAIHWDIGGQGFFPGQDDEAAHKDIRGASHPPVLVVATTHGSGGGMILFPKRPEYMGGPDFQGNFIGEAYTASWLDPLSQSASLGVLRTTRRSPTAMQSVVSLAKQVFGSISDVQAVFLREARMGFELLACLAWKERDKSHVSRAHEFSEHLCNELTAYGIPVDVEIAEMYEGKEYPQPEQGFQRVL